MESAKFNTQSVIKGNLCLNFNENVNEVEVTGVSADTENVDQKMNDKIKAVGMFSEDIAFVLTLLLRDNEKYKNLIENGFTALEDKLLKLADCVQAEREERVCEIASINHTLITHEYQIEALRNKVTDIETLNNSLLDNLDIKLAEATKIATDDRLVDIEEEINDIGGKMNLSVMDLSEKISALENDIENMRKMDELQILKADLKSNIHNVHGNLKLLENAQVALEINTSNEINKYEHKVSLSEALIKKELADLKNSSNTNSESISRLKSSICDKIASVTEKDEWTSERFHKVCTDFESKLSLHEDNLMLNIETVLENFEKKLNSGSHQVELTKQQDLKIVAKKVKELEKNMTQLTNFFNKDVALLRSNIKDKLEQKLEQQAGVNKIIFDSIQILGDKFKSLS